MVREYRIMSAVYGRGVPVARPLVVCTDASVVGVPWYLAAFVRGRVFRDMSLPEVPPSDRSAMYVLSWAMPGG